MAKETVVFLKNHGRYVRGDVAGFESTAIAKWPRGVCVPYSPETVERMKAGAGATGADIESRAVLDAQEEVLNSRAASLDAREAALAKREAALSGAVTEPAAKSEPVSSEANTSSTKGAGSPPKQGDKT